MRRRIGSLRHRVAVQSNSPATDSYGEKTDSWSTDTTVWMGVKVLRGRELEAARAEYGEATHRFTMRQPAATVTAAHRLLFESRAFDIRHVANLDELGRYSEIVANELT